MAVVSRVWGAPCFTPDSSHPLIQNDGMHYDGLRFRAVCKLAGKIYGQRRLDPRNRRSAQQTTDRNGQLQRQGRPTGAHEPQPNAEQ